MPAYIPEDRIDKGSGISVDLLDISDGRKAGHNDTAILFDISNDRGWVIERNTASHSESHPGVYGPLIRTHKQIGKAACECLKFGIEGYEMSNVDVVCVRRLHNEGLRI